MALSTVIVQAPDGDTEKASVEYATTSNNGGKESSPGEEAQTVSSGSTNTDKEIQNVVKNNEVSVETSRGRATTSDSAGLPKPSLRERRLDSVRRSRAFSGAHSALWGAHDAGLAVTPTASRRSVVARRTSIAAHSKIRRSSVARRPSSALRPSSGGVLSMADAASLVSAEFSEILEEESEDEEEDTSMTPKATQEIPSSQETRGLESTEKHRSILRTKPRRSSLKILPALGGNRERRSLVREVSFKCDVKEDCDALLSSEQGGTKQSFEESTAPEDAANDRMTTIKPGNVDKKHFFKDLATRRASRNSYDGEGFELLSLDESRETDDKEHAKPLKDKEKSSEERRDSNCDSTAAESETLDYENDNDGSGSSRLPRSPRLTLRRASSSRKVYSGQGIELSVDDEEADLDSSAQSPDLSQGADFMPNEISRAACRRPSADLSVTSFDDGCFLSVRDLTGDKMIEHSLFTPNMRAVSKPFLCFLSLAQ